MQTERLDFTERELRLAAERRPWKEIGEKLGINASTAWKLVKQAKEAVVLETATEAKLQDLALINHVFNSIAIDLDNTTDKAIRANLYEKLVKATKERRDIIGYGTTKIVHFGSVNTSTPPDRELELLAKSCA